ncbi:MAG: oligosaccharide flippase family protein [Cytophagales bacterium]
MKLKPSVSKLKSYLWESKTPLVMALFSVITLSVSFFSNSVIAKELGATAYGQYNFITGLIMLLGMSASFGLDTLSFSLFNQKNNTFSSRQFFNFSLSFTFITGALLTFAALTALKFIFPHELFTNQVFVWLAFGIFMQGFMTIGIAWLRTFDQVLISHALTNTLRVCVQGAFILFIIEFTNLYDFEWALFSYSISYFIALVPLAFIVIKIYPFKHPNTKTKPMDWLKKSSYIFIYEITHNFYQHIDIFILELLNKGSEMGVYLMARKLSLFASLFTTLMGANNQGIMSKLHFEDKITALQSHINRQCRISLISTCIIALLIFILSGYFVQWLGKDFSAATEPLIILLLGEILISSFGNLSLFFPVSGIEKKGKLSVWIATGIQVCLAPIVWPFWGPNGFALVVVLANLVKCLIQNYIVKKNRAVSFGVF